LAVPTILESEASPQAKPLFFGPREERLFGWYHAATGRSRDCVVVLCNPWGYEALCSHRSYVHLAERLAAAGFPTLRFDYLSTGDSGGEDDSESGRLRGWISSIQQARREAMAISGAKSVTLFGVRFGATLAAAAAFEDAVDGLILWSPLLRGRAYLRELRAFGLIKNPSAPKVEADTGGILEASGFFLGTADQAQAGALDLLRSPGRPCREALILARDETELEKPLVAHLAASGVDATFQYVPGYAEMMREPHESIPPEKVFDQTLAWLTRRHGLMEVVPAVDAGRLATTGLELEGCRERGVVFGARGMLTGVLTEPNDGASNLPVILLLNVGSNHHIGPSRLWVSLARAWAARGFQVLRFDVTGLGDSFAPDEPASRRLYAKASIPDVKDALDLLGVQRGDREALVVGLCSGAYLAFYSALVDERVRALTLVNLQTFHWKEGDSLDIAFRGSYKSTRFYLGTVFQPQLWGRVLRGEVNLSGIFGALFKRLKRKVGLILVPKGDASDSIDVAQAFRSLSERGTRALLVYSGEDGGIDELELHLGANARKMRGRPGFRMEVIPGADHIFTARSARERLMALLAEQLDWLLPGSRSRPHQKSAGVG
jgi:pimeloyl-ACP methyl ester carboxylesterase